jgi:hypothetical protein
MVAWKGDLLQLLHASTKHERPRFGWVRAVAFHGFTPSEPLIPGSQVRIPCTKSSTGVLSPRVVAGGYVDTGRTRVHCANSHSASSA